MISNNIKIDKNTIKKNNKKLGLWNITAEIIKIYSGGSYKIKIISDENEFFLANEEYYINNTCIKKINENLCKKLNEEFQKNLEKRIKEIYGDKNDNIEDVYCYSSADNSLISSSDFGQVDEDEFIIEELKKQLKLYIHKSKYKNK